jgi:hypothetical protein
MKTWPRPYIRPLPQHPYHITLSNPHIPTSPIILLITILNPYILTSPIIISLYRPINLSYPHLLIFFYLFHVPSWWPPASSSTATDVHRDDPGTTSELEYRNRSLPRRPWDLHAAALPTLWSLAGTVIRYLPIFYHAYRRQSIYSYKPAVLIFIY